MTPTLKILVSAIALLLAPAARHNPAGAPLKILWIGNSYTDVNDMPKIIEELADSSKVARHPEFTRILKGGETLKGHWANPELQKALAEKWDVVVMQEQSTTPITAPDSMMKYGKLKVIGQDPSVELYQKDGSHPLPQGSYIGACVFYETFFGKSPVGLPAIGVTPEEARRDQSAAHAALSENR